MTHIHAPQGTIQQHGRSITVIEPIACRFNLTLLPYVHGGAPVYRAQEESHLEPIFAHPLREGRYTDRNVALKHAALHLVGQGVLPMYLVRVVLMVASMP